MFFPEFHGYLIASAGIVLTPTPLPSGEGTRAGGASCRLRRLSFSLSFQSFVVLHKKKEADNPPPFKYSKFLNQSFCIRMFS